VVIASAYRTEDPGFESLPCVRFLGLYTLQCFSQNLIRIVIVFIDALSVFAGEKLMLPFFKRKVIAHVRSGTYVRVH
jgi:hypothetical protein